MTSTSPSWMARHCSLSSRRSAEPAMARTLPALTTATASAPEILCRPLASSWSNTGDLGLLARSCRRSSQGDCERPGTSSSVLASSPLSQRCWRAPRARSRPCSLRRKPVRGTRRPRRSRASPRAECTGLAGHPVDPGAVGAAQVFDVDPVSSSSQSGVASGDAGSCRQTSHSASEPIVAEPGSSTYVRRRPPTSPTSRRIVVMEPLPIVVWSLPRRGEGAHPGARCLMLVAFPWHRWN